MLSPSNVGVLVGGLVADPESIDTKSGKIYKFRVGADRAGSDSGKVASGYFDVVFFDNNDNPSGNFVRRQIEEGKFKKGSQLHILYRLNQERWKTEGGESRSKITLIAEAITYASFSSDGTNRSEGGSAPAVEAQAEINLPAAW
jgi:single-stranded DNA-binding protein